MPVGMATAAIVIATSNPSTQAIKVETPRMEITRMELTRYENEKVILHYSRCSETEGKLAIYEVPNKKPVKGCWYSELTTAQIFWENGKNNSFEINEFTFFSKEVNANREGSE